MTPRATSLSGGATRRIVVWRQLAVGLALFGAYLLVDALPGAARLAAAERHGRDLYALEQQLFLDIERPANAWLASHEVLATIANYEYAFTYILSALAVLVWVYLRHPDMFARTRDSFVLLNVIGLACFAFYPVTPPRLLPGLGFADTVTQGHTWGSWGSGLVDHANQHAAVPSLHVAWALWVSAILAWLTVRRWVQVVSALHVVVTVAVTVATANHYLLDVVAAVVLVAVAVPPVNAWYDHRRRRGLLVPPCDAFFLHVETATAAQHVGGLVIFDPVDASRNGSSDGWADQPTVARVREVVDGELDHMPRFRQRLAAPARWRRPRWVDVEDLDWFWHVTERRSRDGVAGLWRIVADLAEAPLPRDRPLWRIVMVGDVAAGQSALIFVMHHAIADGIGTVLYALRLMRPSVGLPGGGTIARPSPARLAVATGIGLAQLATDGGMGGRLGDGSPRRAYATVGLDLSALRRLTAELGARFTDLLLALVGTAVASTHPDLAEQVRGRLRVSVPLMVRSPDSAAEGNATAAVMIDVPVDGRPFADLLTEIGRRTARLRTPTRALASRFVMANGLRVLPEPTVTWFARTVYGRRFFHAIVSNMPGPTHQLSIDGIPIEQVYPILPLAPGAPLAVGALSWNGILGLGVTTDLASVDADVVAARIVELIADLASARPVSAGSGKGPRQSEEESRA